MILVLLHSSYNGDIMYDGVRWP